MATIRELVEELEKIQKSEGGEKQALTESAISATADYITKMKGQFAALESGEPVKEAGSSAFRSMITSLTNFSRPVKEEAEMDSDEKCEEKEEEKCEDSKKKDIKESESYKRAYEVFGGDDRKVSECIDTIASIMEDYRSSK